MIDTPRTKPCVYISNAASIGIRDRIIACVNACAGMENPQQEIAELRAANSKLSEDFSELIAKLQYEKDVNKELKTIIRSSYDTLKDATDNCLWRSDSPIPLNEEESLRIYSRAMETLEELRNYL